jgi:hypothetical protein
MRLELVEEAAPMTVEEAERSLSQLERERDGLPSAMAEAARLADGAQLGLLRRRADEIEDEIFGAKVRALRLTLSQEEEKQAGLEQELRARDAELTEATNEAKRLQDLANAALERRGAIILRALALEASIQNARETMAELRAEISCEINRASGIAVEERDQYGQATGRKVFPRKESAA